MKKATIFFMLLIFSMSSFSQQTDPPPTLTKQDYLKKSKNQKTAAWILLGGGAVLGVGGAVWAGSDWEATAPGALLIVGGVSILSSIPMFIVSGKNKKRAMSLSFKNETAPQLGSRSFVYRHVPSLNLKISL